MWGCLSSEEVTQNIPYIPILELTIKSNDINAILMLHSLPLDFNKRFLIITSVERFLTV
jgi:hypothetical protein